MKRSRKKFLWIVSLLVSCFLFGIVSNAEEWHDGMVVDGSLLTSDLEASDTQELHAQVGGIIEPYGIYLSNGVSTITNKGNGVVYVLGETFCNKTSDKVYAKVYLERLSNGGWSTIKTHSSTSYNTYYTAAGVSFSVAKGYYYRVKGYHTAEKNGKLESTFTYTSGIYIG
ncbi:MAG: hypothetical protein EGR15_03065 [Lachnospiraceae bacterium]|nr:hypothetical protein [Lachnospiraceae bacterium]